MGCLSRTGRAAPGSPSPWPSATILLPGYKTSSTNAALGQAIGFDRLGADWQCLAPFLGEYTNNIADSEDQSQPAGERLIYDLNAAPDPASGSGNNLVGNLLVAQSGGPTAVINASVAGVIQEAGRHLDNIEEIYGGLNGIYGILHENLIT